MNWSRRRVKAIFEKISDAFVPYILLSFMPDRIETILSDTKLFFIVGMGRSGTDFLSHLLNKVPFCVVYHETRSDRKALIDAYWSSDKSIKYLSGSRKHLLAARILENKAQIYGEVNSYLRYHVDAFQDIWDPVILHLVRDGRMVVRSIMNRKSFTADDKKHTGNLYPLPDDPYFEKWDKMDRFARVCWYWASTNRYLLDRHLPVVRLEDIITSYELFSDQVLLPLGLNLSFELWSQQITKPRNVGQDNSFPVWDEWTVKQRKVFTDICGPVMTDLGYAIDSSEEI